MSITRIQHGKVSLALHTLRGAATPGGSAGRSLLLLHGLGERSPKQLPAELADWPGPVHALDFTGHGESTLPGGGGYTAEILMGDADAALAYLGSATIWGRGLGAYIALLVAGGRPAEVRGAVLGDGPGLAGGNPDARPTGIALPAPAAAAPPPDPYAVVELSRDVRPPDYATMFAGQALRLSGLAEPIAVCAADRPSWLEAVIGERGVQVRTLEAALATFARVQ